MRRIGFIIFVLISTICIIPAKTQAIDPVTIAILTPIALKAAEVMAPYVEKGLVEGGKGLLDVGVNACEILYLPLGVVQSTLGLPFGGLSSGLGNIGKGLWAPFKMTGNVLLLPIRFMGYGG